MFSGYLRKSFKQRFWNETWVIPGTWRDFPLLCNVSIMTLMQPSAALAAPLAREPERKSQVKVFRLLHKATAVISIWEFETESWLQNSARNL